MSNCRIPLFQNNHLFSSTIPFPEKEFNPDCQISRDQSQTTKTETQSTLKFTYKNWTMTKKCI